MFEIDYFWPIIKLYHTDFRLPYSRKLWWGYFAPLVYCARGKLPLLPPLVTPLAMLLWTRFVFVYSSVFIHSLYFRSLCSGKIFCSKLVEGVCFEWSQFGWNRSPKVLHLTLIRSVTVERCWCRFVKLCPSVNCGDLRTTSEWVSECVDLCSA